MHAAAAGLPQWPQGQQHLHMLNCSSRIQPSHNRSTLNVLKNFTFTLLHIDNSLLHALQRTRGSKRAFYSAGPHAYNSGCSAGLPLQASKTQVLHQLLLVDCIAVIDHWMSNRTQLWLAKLPATCHSNTLIEVVRQPTCVMRMRQSIDKGAWSQSESVGRSANGWVKQARQEGLTSSSGASASPTGVEILHPIAEALSQPGGHDHSPHGEAITNGLAQCDHIRDH